MLFSVGFVILLIFYVLWPSMGGLIPAPPFVVELKKHVYIFIFSFLERVQKKKRPTAADIPFSIRRWETLTMLYSKKKVHGLSCQVYATQSRFCRQGYWLLLADWLVCKYFEHCKESEETKYIIFPLFSGENCFALTLEILTSPFKPVSLPLLAVVQNMELTRFFQRLHSRCLAVKGSWHDEIMYCWIFFLVKLSTV